MPQKGMGSMAQVIMDLSTTILAIVIGMFTFRRMPTWSKLMLLQVLLYLAFDLTGWYLRPDNTVVYNLFMPIETALLIWLAISVLQPAAGRLTFALFFGLFLVVFLLEFSVSKYAYHAGIVQGIIVTVLYLLLLYRATLNQVDPEVRTSLIILSLGVVPYFACTVPYLAILYHFQEADPVLNKQLYLYIVLFLAHLRYFLIALSFLFLPRVSLRLYNGA
jgi:hypothetical protein